MLRKDENVGAPRFMTAVLPLFQNGPGIKKGLGLPLPRLKELVEQGAVRTIKFGASKQAGRLYSTRDVECALEKMAVGKKPKKMVQAMTAGGASNE